MIIQSLLDNDFYKFTMMEAVQAKYGAAITRYQFINRDLSFTFTPDFLKQLQKNLSALADLQLTAEEYTWLKQNNLFSPKYLESLKNFRLNPAYIQASLENQQLILTIEGPWFDTILFEVPVLAIITQTYYETIQTSWDHDLEHYKQKSLEKGRQLSLAKCVYSDFGTRRRRSYKIQETALRALLSTDKDINTFAGTSNVHFARILNTHPIGTMAHEWIMGHAGMFGIENAHITALQAWLDVHHKKYAIALTDTYTSDLFFKDFTPELAHAYDGLRQDSGDPFEFTDKAIKRYKELGIYPLTKKIVYSDGLSIEKAIKIQQYTQSKVIPRYGIGTCLTNDFNHKNSLNIVIKLFSINSIPVAKVTDSPNKASGPSEAVATTLKTVESLIATR